MNYCLMGAVLSCAVLAAAAPGMRGNGASGAFRDRDPGDPRAWTGTGTGTAGQASAAASGTGAAVNTYVEDTAGSRLSVARASTHGGGAAVVARA